MEGISIFAGWKEKGYSSKLKSTIAVAEGQLVFLNKVLIDNILSVGTDYNAKLYESSKVYAQMLRIFYTIDRIHSIENESYAKNVESIDYASSIASNDIHDLVIQCNSIDNITKNINAKNKKDGNLQKIISNPSVIDQLSQWISKENQDPAVNKKIQTFLLSYEYSQALSSLSKTASQEDDPQMKVSMMDQKNFSWNYLLTGLKNSFCDNINLGVPIGKKLSSKKDNLVSFNVFLQSVIPDEIDRDNIFAKHYFGIVDKERMNTELFNKINDKSRDNLVQTLSKKYPGFTMETPRQVVLGNGSYREEKKHEYFIGVDKANDVKFESVLVSFLTNIQAQILIANSESVDQIYDQDTIIQNLFVEGKINLPSKMDESQIKFFNTIINEIDVIKGSVYDFYKNMHAECVNLPSGSELSINISDAHEYLFSPEFNVRLEYMKNFSNVFAAANDKDSSRVFSQMSKVVTYYRASLRNLVKHSKSKFASDKELLDFNEWNESVRRITSNPLFEKNGVSDEELGNYEKISSLKLYDFKNPSYRSISIIDRVSAASIKPLESLDIVSELLRDSHYLSSIPANLQAKIVCEYLYFDNYVVWDKDIKIFNKVTRELSNAVTEASKDRQLIADSYVKNTNQIDQGKIFSAIESNNHNFLKFLLGNGASIDQQNGFGLTPIQYAVQLDNVKLLKILMLHVKNGGAPYPLPLKLAVECNSPETLKYMISVLGAANVKSDILHVAVKRKKLEMIDEIIKSGVDIEIKDKFGKVAADYIAYNNKELAEALSGKLVNSSDIEGHRDFVANIKNDSSSLRQLSQYFAKNSKGSTISDIILPSSIYLSLFIAVGCFVAAFFYPVNLLLNLSMTFCWLTVLLESYSNTQRLPCVSKLDELKVSNGFINPSTVNGANSSSIAMFPLKNTLAENKKGVIDPVLSVKEFGHKNKADSNVVSITSCVKV